MSKPVRFTQADLRRAVAGVAQAGVLIRSIEIDPATGKIIILPANGKPEHDNDEWADLT